MVQRKLDVLKSIALLLLFASCTFATIVYCAAVKEGWALADVVALAGAKPMAGTVELENAVALAGVEFNKERNLEKGEVEIDKRKVLKAAGFIPLTSAVPFITILLAGTAALVAAPSMEESKRKFAWAATSLAYLGTLTSFIYYTNQNVKMPDWSLVVNFGASTIITVGVLVLITLAAFKAE